MKTNPAVRGVLCSLALLLSVACGPSLSTQVRWNVSSFDENEDRQEKSGITVERVEIAGVPTEMMTKVQLCDANGVPKQKNVGTKKAPSMAPVIEDIQLVDGLPNLSIFKLKVTNNTEHVLRFNRAVIRLFDPAGNQHEPKSPETIEAEFQTKTGMCSSAQAAAPRIKLIKFLHKNIEIVPGTSSDGFVAFNLPPGMMEQVGIWKFAIYEVPIETDDAGNVTKTERFEIRTNVEKYLDSYKKANMFAKPVLVSSEKQGS